MYKFMYVFANKQNILCVLKPMCMMTPPSRRTSGDESRLRGWHHVDSVWVPKLSLHTKPTLDTQLPSSTSVLRLLAHWFASWTANQNDQMPTDRWAPMPPCRICRKKADEDQLQPWRGTHWENTVGQRTKTARWLTIGLVCTGLKAETSMLK